MRLSAESRYSHIEKKSSECFELSLADFLGDVVESEDKIIHLIARGVRRERQNAIGNAACDERGGKPASIFQFFTPLSENGEVFSRIGRGILFENPCRIFVELDLKRKTSRRIDDSCAGDVRLCQNRLCQNRRQHRGRTQNGNGLARRRRNGDFDVNTQCGDSGFVFIRLAAAKQRKRQSRREIEIELSGPNSHSAITKPQHTNKVKNYGKTIQQNHQTKTPRQLSQTQKCAG